MLNFSGSFEAYATCESATCETSQVLLAGVPGGFSQGSPIFAHLLIGSYELK